MDTIYLDHNQIPAQLRRGYNGRHFKATVTEQVTIPMTAGLWSGGSRDMYRVVRLSDGADVPAHDQSAPWSNTRQDCTIKLEPGIAVVEHTIFCGKDRGLTFYIHPANATAMLPPKVELGAVETLVLNATCSYKSSYMGRDRYDMAKGNAYGKPFPSRQEWDAAKATLIAQGYLNKAGAVTTKGRNAGRSRNQVG